MALFKLFQKEKKVSKTEAERMFAGVYNHDELKPVMYDIVMSKKRSAALLIGPPATAKSLFALKTSEYFGKNAAYTYGSSSSKAGVFDYCFRNPKIEILVIDELDKMKKEDQASLLNLMESGVLSDMKVGKQRSVKMNVTVVATANDEKKIIRPLMTRFEPNVFHMHEYTEDEYMEIGREMLAGEEGIKEDVAEIITRKVYELSTPPPNIRAVVKVARYINNDITKLDSYLEVIRKYQK
jgi:DNA replicative helicase MCM subunit Mcm2 (Cdc46/Mcm family)